MKRGTEGVRDWDPQETERIAASLKDEPGALMLILHRVLDTFGCVPGEAVPIIASVLNLTRADVHGVVTFYHDFRGNPPGRNVIRVCRAESCQAMGGGVLADHIRGRIGADFGATSAAGDFTLEPVYCFGNCACSPAIMINGELHGRMNPQRFDRLMHQLSTENR